MRGTPRSLLFTGLALFFLFSASSAFATHDARAFELDANAVNGSASGDDWNTVVPVDRSGTDIVSSFVADAPVDASYFTGGGSKDPNDVPDWAYTAGDVAPDKNEITNAFAVAYHSPRDTGRTNVGDLLVYFGLDRYANNGDAQVGFWFFRGPVGMGSGGSFSGRHTVGDILVLSHFTQGGRVSDVKVYSWVGSGGSDGTLDLLLNAGECGSAGGDDAGCAIVNQSSAPAPWPYTPKSGTAGVFAQGSFYEGGINVTRLVPGVACFKAFAAESRTSQSVDAQLKDLALGPFDTCPVTTSSGPNDPAPAPNGPPLAATGNGTGPLALVGFGLLTAGLAARVSGERLARAARAATAASAAARWFEATRALCSAGVRPGEAPWRRAGAGFACTWPRAKRRPMPRR